MPRRTASEMSAVFETFALEYLAKGMNSAAAYRAVHPRASKRTAETQGSEYLKKPEVQQVLDRERRASRRRLQMDGDEAIERLTLIARADVRRLFIQGHPTPVDQLPEDVAVAIKMIKIASDGAITIQLHDKVRVLELLAVNAGRIRQRHDHKLAFDHAAYLSAEPPAGDTE